MLLFYIQDPDELVIEEEENLEPKITACALFGTPAPKSIKTMKVRGMIKTAQWLCLLIQGVPIISLICL